MIIKAKPLPFNFIKMGASILMWYFRRRFNKMVINEVEIKPGHSYLLLCNHFGFLDGFFAFYIALKFLDKKQPIKGIYTMSLKRQMEKNWWLKYCCSFSVEPGKRSVAESLDYAAELMSVPGNLLIYYPQGNLESQHIRKIEFKDGVYEIVTKIKGNCQLIWNSTVIEYYESTKPSAYMTLSDCGTNHGFDFEDIKKKVNGVHLQAMKKTVRFTAEDIDR